MLVSQIYVMGSVRSLLLLFLLSLVEVHCQTFPYVSFLGQTLVNHSYVNFSTVGDGNNSVQCHTDMSTCCSGSQGFHRGDWYFPSGDRLPLSGNVYEARGAQRVELRRTTATGPTGIYRCAMPTNAVSDNTDNSVRDTVYVGLYFNDEGINIQDNTTIATSYSCQSATFMQLLCFSPSILFHSPNRNICFDFTLPTLWFV